MNQNATYYIFDFLRFFKTLRPEMQNFKNCFSRTDLIDKVFSITSIFIILNIAFIIVITIIIIAVNIASITRDS